MPRMFIVRPLNVKEGIDFELSCARSDRTWISCTRKPSSTSVLREWRARLWGRWRV